MKNIALILLFCLSCSLFFALEIVLKDGRILSFPNADFAKLKQEEITTFRTREEGVRTDKWKGIRFDNWLKEKNLRDFSTIRFESDDRYQMSFEKVAFDTTSCWLVTQNDKEIFAPENYRIIFPNLMQNHWVRNISKVVLQDFRPIARPVRVYFVDQDRQQNWSPELQNLKLHQDPKPFVNIRGYFLEDLLKTLKSGKKADLVFFSRDGFKLRLNYPLDLKGAVLELTEAGNLNLKSPQIPGGMWVKDLVYIQIGKTALLQKAALNRLIDLNQHFGWQLTADAKVKLIYPKSSIKIGFATLLAEPERLNGLRWLQLYKK